MNRQIGVFIPARTTSKRLPHKIILPFGHTNLFDIACKKLEELPDKYGKYALVCEEELIEIAESHNVKILLRDKETIEIDDPIRVVMGAVEQAEEKYLMFLNPCLAFFTTEMILHSLEEFEKLLESGIEYATSVKPFKNWIFDENANAITPINYSELNTKNIVGLYQAAHCFHIFNKEEFLQTGQMLQPKHGLIEVPMNATIDVDTLDEYEYARWKYEKDLRNRFRRNFV